MKGSSGRLALAVAIPLLVIPLAGLAWLAARSVDRQELEMRSRLRESLLLEVGQTNGRINAWFADLSASLSADSPLAGSGMRPTSADLEAWKEKDPLVGVPFLLDSSLSIAYPDPAEASEENRLFYWRYLNVFGNVEPIPVYRNIASEYEASIVGTGSAARDTAPPPAAVPKQPAAEDAKKPAAAVADSRAGAESGTAAPAPGPAGGTEVAAEKEAAPPPAKKSPFGSSPQKSAPVPESIPLEYSDEASTPAETSAPAIFRAQTEYAAPAPATAPATAPAEKDDAAIVRSKVAQSLFETDAAVQKRVYDLAAGEGKETLTRNVNPAIDAVDTRSSAPARSVYIESDRYFRDLVAQGDRGLVPRIFDNSFVLLFWEKKGDWIVGCELDMGAVREAISARSGNPADGVRYLAVLDQSGSPLVPVPNVEAAAWRTPLVSGEISEYLPYWETAIILADPDAFENRVRASRYALSALVFVFFLSVSLGAVLLWRHSANRLLEARRRTGFVTTVSHELKTPLTSIRLYSEMLAEGADLDREKRDRYLARIVGESERLTRLINNVLDVAKLERGKARPTRVPLDAALIVRETVGEMAERLERAGFALSLAVGEPPLTVLADRDALVRILVNLLSNAEKYSGSARKIDVSVGADKRGRRCLITVADRGIGVPRPHRKKIFREFHRVDSSITSEKGGTGLGLSIARTLARSLGGELTYRPRDRRDGGKGSAFTLSLPLAGPKEGKA